MKPRTLIRVFGTLLALSVAKYLWLARYAHPVADDFCYAAKSAGQSLWDWSHSEWLYWNGRFASNLLMIHGPLTWFPDMLTGYRLVPILLIALTFLGFWALLHRACQGHLGRGQELMGALVWLALYLNLMPDLGEGFYWYTGAITYQLGNILLLFHLALLFPSGRGRYTAPLLLLNLLLAVAIVGMDEIHMLMMLGLHMGLGLWRMGTQRKVGSSLLFIPLVAAASLLMAVAPGNAVRGAMYADTQLFWYSLGMSALQSLRFVAGWVLSPGLLAMALLYIPLHHRLTSRIPALQRLLRIPGWMALLLPFLLVMATTFPAYWSTGLLGQHRTINVACLFSIPALFLVLAAALQRGPLRRLAGLAPSAQRMIATMALALIALQATRNELEVHKDLWGGRAAAYDRELARREAQIRAAASDPAMQVVLVRLADPPRTLPSYEEHGALRSWMLHCEARFFGAHEDQVEMIDPSVTGPMGE